MQSRLLDAQGFKDTYAQLLTDQGRLRTTVKKQREKEVNNSMQRCVSLCRARDARRQRLERLKRTLDHSRGFLGADPQTLLESWESNPMQRNSISGSPAPEQTPRSESAPNLTGRTSHLHSRKVSASSSTATETRLCRRRESTAGVAVHAPGEHHREGSSPSMHGADPSGDSNTGGARAGAAGDCVGGMSGGSNEVRGDSSLESPDHTGARFYGARLF